MIHIFAAYNSEQAFESAGHDKLAAIEDVAVEYWTVTQDLKASEDLGKTLARMLPGTTCQWKEFELSYSTQER